MVNLLIVGRYLHYILSCHLISSLSRYFHPCVERRPAILHLGAGCSAVQVYRCTGVQGTGVHYGHNTIQLCHGLSWLLHLLSTVSSETYICWSLALSREKILSVA